MSWGGKRNNSGRKKGANNIVKKKGSKRGGSRIGAGRKKGSVSKASSQNEKTIEETFQEARERRNHILAHFPSKPEVGSPENSESEESTSDYDDYYQYDDLDGSESSESSESSDSDDSDDEDNPEAIMEPNLRWYAIDSSINRALRQFRSELDDCTSYVRRQLELGYFRFPPQNPSVSLKKKISSRPDFEINGHDFYMKEV
jgi:hypothetical protein